MAADLPVADDPGGNGLPDDLRSPLCPRQEPGPDAAAALAVQAALDAGTRRLLGAVFEARAGLAEGVHQMRVGARRLRSALRTFRPLLDRDGSEPLREELWWLGKTLGAVRDQDVLRGRLEADSAGDRETLAPLFQRLDDRHRCARIRLLDALDSRRFGDLQGQLIAATRRPPVRPEAAFEPCRTALPPLVATAWKELARTARVLDRDAPDEAWHGVRILAKRARYAAEAVAPALGPESGSAALAFAQAAQHLQDVLGEHQDAIVAAREIAGLAAAAVAGSKPHFQEAVRRLISRQNEAAARARTQFRKAWRQLDRKSLRRWLRP